MNKEILIAFTISASVCAFALFAHVHDAGHTHDYGAQYNHEKKDFDSKPHHDGEFFPDYNAWLGAQLEKEDKAKTIIDKGISVSSQWIDPFSAGVDASNHICNNSVQDHDHQPAEHESESNYR